MRAEPLPPMRARECNARCVLSSHSLVQTYLLQTCHLPPSVSPHSHVSHSTAGAARPAAMQAGARPQLEGCARRAQRPERSGKRVHVALGCGLAEWQDRWRQEGSTAQGGEPAVASKYASTYVSMYVRNPNPNLRPYVSTYVCK